MNPFPPELFEGKLHTSSSFILHCSVFISQVLGYHITMIQLSISVDFTLAQYFNLFAFQFCPWTQFIFYSILSPQHRVSLGPGSPFSYHVSLPSFNLDHFHSCTLSLRSLTFEESSLPNFLCTPLFLKKIEFSYLGLHIMLIRVKLCI